MKVFEFGGRACVVVALAAACSSRVKGSGNTDDTDAAGGAAGTDAGSGGAGGSDAVGDATGGAAGNAAGGSSTANDCDPGERRCTGVDTRELCNEDAEWQEAPACSAELPLCSNGVCSGIVLRGGIGTLSLRPAGTEAIRLVGDGFTALPRSCNDSICVEGGISP
jgi:hypothetical protein